MAASYNKIDIVEYLLKSGADVHTAGYGGQTALHNAAGSKHFFHSNKISFPNKNFT